MCSIHDCVNTFTLNLYFSLSTQMTMSMTAILKQSPATQKVILPPKHGGNIFLWCEDRANYVSTIPEHLKQNHMRNKRTLKAKSCYIPHLGLPFAVWAGKKKLLFPQKPLIKKLKLEMCEK